MEPEDEEALVDHIRWVASHPGKDGMDGIALGVEPKLAKPLSDAFDHRIAMNELQGLSVGGVVMAYFNVGLYDTQIVKRYRLVHIPQQQGELWEVHHSFWHGSGGSQFIPVRWNDKCECYQPVNPDSTFELCYD